MPVYLGCNFRLVDTKTEIIQLDCRNTTLLAWWYCGIYKNARDQSQPLILVAFRTKIDDKCFSDHLTYRYIPITQLGQVRIGSLCQDNRVIAYATYEIQEFDLLYEKGGWWFTSFDKAAELSRSTPFPQQIHPLAYKRDKNWLLQFRLPNKGTLVIPCLEYFTRRYGQSAELRRILMTYQWSGSGGCLDRFFSTLGQPENLHGPWEIMLKKDLYNGDATFLAHVKYDAYTQRVAKSIYSSIEVQYSGNPTNAAFTKIGPWYTGNVTLRVAGIPFNDGNSFLGLQILGGTEPVGKNINLGREKSESALNHAGSDKEGNVWSGAQVRRPNHRPDLISLTAFEEPDNGGAAIDLEDPEYVIMGPKRVVSTHRYSQTKTSGALRILGDDTNIYSAGEAHGNGKGIGYASVKIETVLESEGALRDMWNAMLNLKKRYPDLVRSVEWYSQSQGFVQSDNPKLVALSPFNIDDVFKGKSIENNVINWLYIDPVTRSEVRGLLITRININNTYVYIIEVQRRPRMRKGTNGKIIHTEESFKGLVFCLSDKDKTYNWLNFVLSQVRYVTGVVHKLTKYCPGKADSFKHVPASSDEVPCWSALQNALNKMGIQIN